MARLCASNQPHSVYPHISLLIHLCLCSPICISTTVFRSSGPDAGPFVRLLVEAPINLSVIRRKGPHCHQKGGIVMRRRIPYFGDGV